MQNLYNLVRPRRPRTCSTTATEHGIGFIPWFPLAAGELAEPGRRGRARSPTAHDATPGQVALAWLLAAQPGDAADPRHGLGRAPRENVAAASLRLTGDEVATLDAATVT